MIGPLRLQPLYDHTLICTFLICKSMEIQEFSADIVLAAALVLSSLLLIHRVWSDPIATTGAVVMMVALSGLFLLLHRRISLLERSLASYQRTTRVNLEEIADTMLAQYNRSSSHVDEVVNEISRRVYR